MLAEKEEERNDLMAAELAVSSPTKSLAVRQPNTDIFKVSSFAEAFEVAKVLADSGMVPKAYLGKPAAIMASWQFSMELGVGLMQGLQGISNINGTPAVFGDLGWAIVTNHPEFEDADEEFKADSVVCTLKRKGRKPVTREYTISMAKEAMLMGKDNWKHHPRRMLQWRARSWAMRDLFPDALKGLELAEVVQDYDQLDAPPSQPKPQGQIAVPTVDAKTTLAEVLLPAKDEKPAEEKPQEAVENQDADPAPEDDPEVRKALEEEARAWATEYYQSYKAHSTKEQSLAFLQKHFQITDSRQVPSDQREFAMAQAKQGFPCMKAQE